MTIVAGKHRAHPGCSSWCSRRSEDSETWGGNLLALVGRIGLCGLAVGFWFLVAWLLAGCPT